MSIKYQRVMIKITGEALLGQRKYGIEPQAVQDLALQIKAVHDLGVEIAIVIGGGNIFRGVAGEKKGVDRATADYMGMLATVINGLALEDALIKAKVPVRLQSALTMPSVAEPFIRKKAIRHLEKGRVVILCAGTGNPYVTTDTGASLHALELHCQVLMKATKVDGVYERDPFLDSNAKMYQTLNFKDAIGINKLDIMDSAALAMSMENNLIIHVLQLFADHNLIKAIKGENIGTMISNQVETKFYERNN